MINFIFYAFFLGWAIFSFIYVNRKKKNQSVYEYVYNSIPSVFTTLGILGTFVGIFVGLQEFEVQNITQSIPKLLEGMKTAFSTSIIGIILSIGFGKWSQIVAEKVDIKNGEVAVDDEISALKEILSEIKKQNEISSVFFTDLKKENELFRIVQNQTALEKIKLLTDLKQEFSNQSKEISITNSEIEKLRTEQNQNSKENKELISGIGGIMVENSQKMEKKFDEFSELLRKNNTEALVEVMKKVTEEFNKQMSALINKLIQENFEELNQSVKNLNTWQQENKEMIASLTEQFTKVSKDFETSASSVKVITQNTEKLVNDESHLSRLIKELQKVMIDDSKFTQITSKVSETVATLEKNTKAFDETTNKLNNWVKNQMNFTDSVAVLLTKLEDVKNVKDINEVFWKNFEKQLTTSMSQIEKASNKLTDDLEEINNEFYQQLNSVLSNFDNAIQRILKSKDL